MSRAHPSENHGNLLLPPPSPPLPLPDALLLLLPSLVELPPIQIEGNLACLLLGLGLVQVPLLVSDGVLGCMAAVKTITHL